MQFVQLLTINLHDTLQIDAYKPKALNETSVEAWVNYWQRYSLLPASY